MVRAGVSRGRALALAVGLSAAGASLSAQPAPRSPAGSGWLGVNLLQQFDCVWETTDDWKTCSLVLRVQQLQDGGPAATGGLEIGDQLLAIDGEDVTYENWDRLRSGIRPGSPLSIDVMRDDVRRFVHVVPAPRPTNLAALSWTRGPAAVATGPQRRSFVFTVTEPRGRDAMAFAITVRDGEDDQVDVAPAAIRVIDGQLRLTPLDERVFVEFPELRTELLGDLSQVTETTYRSATSALDVLDRIRERVTLPDFQRRLARIARVGLEQPELATRFVRSFGGAEFEPVRSGLLVLRVVPRTAAAQVGLRSGDLVVRAGDAATRQVGDLMEAVLAEDGAVRIYWLRGTREMSEVWPQR